MIRCFIITPPGDPPGYSQGHVSRVYDFILMPACRRAGYLPIRAGDSAHNDPLQVVKEVVDCEVAICDLSANNTNGLYGVAIRHVLGLPVILVKDNKSVITFDPGELDIVEYDESLRIDTVQKAVDVLGEALNKAVETKKEKHELLYRLNIGLPQVDVQPTEADNPDSVTSDTSDLAEETISKVPALPIISPLPDYVGEAFTKEEIAKLKTGDEFFHLNHGRGKANQVKKSGKFNVASVQFESGTRAIILSASNLLRKIKE
jgi:hypothetical protein